MNASAAAKNIYNNTLLTAACFYKDTLSKWESFNDNIIFDSKSFIDAKLKSVSNPSNYKYCYDLIKAGNDIFKSYLFNALTYHTKLLDIRKDIEKAYNANKDNIQLQKELCSCNEELKHEVEKTEKLSAIIRRNNETIDKLQTEMVYSSEQKDKKKDNDDYYAKILSNIYNKANAKTYGDLCQMLEAETTNNNNDYITKLTGICALDEQPQKQEEDEEKTHNRIEQMTAVQKEALDIFTKKNHDYGDSFATYGPTGVIVRIGDKIQRLQSITRKGIMMVNDEPIRDTLMDLHNYCAMAIMLMDENKTSHSHDIVINEPGFGTYTVGDLQQ